MIQVFIWLVALTVVLVSGAILALQIVLRRRMPGAVLASCCALAATYCLLGADALSVAPTGLDRGWVLLLNSGVVVLTAAAVGLQLWSCRWLIQDHSAASKQAVRKQVGIAALLVCQVAVAGWTGWHFQHALAGSAGEVADGGVAMDDLPGEALLTDKGRLVPVFQARLLNSLAGYSEFNAVAFDDQRIERAPSDSRSNCHGWVFTGGHYLLKGNGVEMILADNDYRLVEQPQPGDVIVYRDIVNLIVHSGLVRAAFPDGLVLVESKWGLEGRYLHRPEDQDYSGSFTYYRSPRSLQRPDGDSPHLVRAVNILPGNILVTQRPEEALVGGRQPANPPLVDMYGQPLPMGESYPIGAE